MAGESNDEELPFTRLPLADENGIKTEAPTLEKQQGYSSLSAASLADTATGVQGGPKGTVRQNSTSVLNSILIDNRARTCNGIGISDVR